MGLTFAETVVFVSGNVFGVPPRITEMRPPPGRERTGDATQPPFHPLACRRRRRGLRRDRDGGHHSRSRSRTGSRGESHGTCLERKPSMSRHDGLGFVGPSNNIESVKAKGTYKVVIRLKTPDSQFIAATVNRVFIVPKHIWTKVGDVANFTNSKPVGSGPYSVITRFTSQDYVF